MFIFILAYYNQQKYTHIAIMYANIVYILRVDLNLCVKVGDFGFTREASYLVSHIQKCPVKWMPPEMLQDGISSEKSDVVSWGLVFNVEKCM